jgi:NADH-quinone oxidoreductase subunit N
VILDNFASLAWALPELVLAGTSLATLVCWMSGLRGPVVGRLALLGVAGACYAAGSQVDSGETLLFDGMIALDAFAVFFKLLLGLAAFGSIWLALASDEVDEAHSGEFYFVLVASTLGMFYMASATNWLMAYLALEFSSLTGYVLTGWRNGARRSSEAALKYLIYGGVASGLMLYGISLIYGLTGSLAMAEVSAVAAAGGANGPVLALAFVLVLVGLGYKVAMVPFHMWAPDVYEGAPLPVTAYLAVGSKAAGFALLLRIVYPTFSAATGDGSWQPLAALDWRALMSLAAIATMTLGNLAALRQDNLKRLLAYSGVAHAGYALMGVVAASDAGLSSVLFYLVVYYVMNLGAFAVVALVARSAGGEDMAAFRGLAWRGGAAPAAAMCVFLFSLAGLPPLGGFVGKMYLFSAAIQAGLWTLVAAAAVNSLLGLAYYARVARVMYMEAPEEGAPELDFDGQTAALVGALAVGTLALGLYWTPLADIADRSIAFFGG